MLGILENHQNLFSWLPKIRKTTFDVSLVHFLLMFGYKLFSLYYPLFLVSIGLSVVKIGWIYLLIYGTIAGASLIINLYLKKFNPAFVASLGIFGYGIYALIMLLVGVSGSLSLPIFYFAQIILGFSAAAWLVSLKLILMKSKTENYNRTFGWFYSAPHYASALAPAIGGIIIWKFGFTGVFLLSVLIQFANAIYAYFKLNGKNLNCWFYSPVRAVKPECKPRKDSTGLKPLWSQLINILKTDKTILTVLAILFLALILGGIYRAFFVLFLKDLNYSQDDIIKFISLISIIYLPLSIIIIKIMEQFKNIKIINRGIIIEGIAAAVLGIFASVLNLLAMFLIMLVDSLSSLAVGSGKSSLLAVKFKKHREEAATIDTVLSTLGPALGGLLGGVMISRIGYQNTFLAGGLAVLIAGIFLWRYNIKR